MPSPAEKISGHQNWQPREEPEVDYKAAWHRFALRWYSALFLLVGWVPVSLWMFSYSRNGWHHPFTALAVILLWFAAALWAVWWSGEFRCPRCRRRYGALGPKSGDTNYTRGFFDRVCGNCKLRKFENG